MIPINKTLSNKIRITVFFATVIVVLRHSPNVHIYFPDVYSRGYKDFNSFFQIFINSFTNIAVPFFFLISGYLFFYGYSPLSTFDKWRKRVKSLLIPFILWNILVLLFFHIIQKIDFISDYSSYQVFYLNFSSILNDIFIKPALGQFWYIRDLIMFVLISPIFYYFYKNKFSCFIIIILLGVFWRPIDSSLFSSEGLFFYFLGGFMAHNNGKLKWKIPSNYTLLLLPVWIGLRLSRILIPELNGIVIVIMEKLSILVGLLFFWFYSDFLIKKWNNKILIQLSSYSFFIYAFQSPLIKIFYKGLLSLLPQNQIISLLVYIVTPSFIIIISIGVAKVLLKYNSKLYSILTGNR